MSQNAMISIITPVYNREDCLPRCIDSILSQSYQNWELIVVDDGSKDKSKSVAETYQENDKRIRVFGFNNNRGTNAARNKAIKEATGDFLLILDSDDWLAENALNRVSDAIATNPGFSHYLFQADDLLDYYSNNNLLNSGDKTTLHFSDWLSHKVSGDFIHVISRPLMQAFPFDEKTRILEGVNFMRFYKAGQMQLYLPFVVTHRDRNRDDSVTPTAYLYNKQAMLRCLAADKAWLSYFTEDCEKMSIHDVLLKKRNTVAILSVATGDYHEYDKLLALDKKIGNKMLRVIRVLHLGWLLQKMIIFYTSIQKK